MMRPFARRVRGLFGAGFLFALGAGGALAVASPAGCAQAPPCVRNSDCSNAYCASGECKQDCVDSEVDCPRGSHCNVVAQCETDEPSGSTTGAGGSTSGSSTSTLASTSSVGGAGPTSSSASGPGSSSASGPGSSSASSGTGGSNPGGKGMLDPCSADGECAVNLACRPLQRNGPEKRCLPTCASNASCPAGTRCELLDGTQYCAGIDVGRFCTDGSSCNFACTGTQYCTMQCASGADCPNGYGCMAIGSPAQRVCVKAEAPCSAQDPSACIVPAACDEVWPTLIVSGCTLACASASDCPRRASGLPSWTCQGGACRRPSDVVGPLEGGAPAEYACNAQGQPINVCNDNQHINFTTFTFPAPPFVDCASPTTTEGFPGDSCLDSCRYQGGCRSGYGCTAVGGLGNERIGLCLPTGTGEVGAPCALDAQCVFGYCSGPLNAKKCSRDCTYDGVCPTGSSCVAVGGPAVEGVAFKRCQ